MWTAVALAATLGLVIQQPGQLTLSNVRATYGPLGVARPDNKVLPGDQLFVAFDIDGVTADPSGKVLYSMVTEFTDAKGKTLIRLDPRDLETINGLGGDRVPAFVVADVGLDTPPGEYGVKVTVTDRASKKTGSMSRTFQVLPAGFGVTRLTTTHDSDARVPASIFESGGSLWVNCGVVGFGWDKATKQPDAIVELRVLDEKGQPTLAKPFTGQIKEKIPSNARYVPVQFLVPLNRPGKFTIEVKATCNVCKAATTLSFPITVQGPK